MTTATGTGDALDDDREGGRLGNRRVLLQRHLDVGPE